LRKGVVWGQTVKSTPPEWGEREKFFRGKKAERKTSPMFSQPSKKKKKGEKNKPEQRSFVWGTNQGGVGGGGDNPHRGGGETGVPQKGFGRGGGPKKKNRFGWVGVAKKKREKVQKKKRGGKCKKNN